MKYAVFIMCLMGGVCIALAYGLGVSACRTTAAAAAVQQTVINRKVDAQIEQQVLAVPDADNLDWLLREYLRAD